MSDLIQLKWNLKNDPHCWLFVFGCRTNIGAMQTLAHMLYKSGICGSIQIVSDSGNLIEDWSKGAARTNTEIFNEQMRQFLEKD